MKIFKRKPKCQRKGKEHVFDTFSWHCIYCGISLTEFDRKYRRHRG